MRTTVAVGLGLLSGHGKPGGHGLRFGPLCGAVAILPTEGAAPREFGDYQISKAIAADHREQSFAFPAIMVSNPAGATATSNREADQFGFERGTGTLCQAVELPWLDQRGQEAKGVPKTTHLFVEAAFKPIVQKAKPARKLVQHPLQGRTVDQLRKVHIVKHNIRQRVVTPARIRPDGSRQTGRVGARKFGQPPRCSAPAMILLTLPDLLYRSGRVEPSAAPQDTGRRPIGRSWRRPVQPATALDIDKVAKRVDHGCTVRGHAALQAQAMLRPHILRLLVVQALVRQQPQQLLQLDCVDSGSQLVI
jgi:hypothetical protein